MNVPILEPTYRKVDHPETLTYGGSVLFRIDDPASDVIRDGDHLLGWEGDARYQLYVDPRRRVWVLMRLQLDGRYRSELHVDATALREGDAVGMILGWVLEHDRNRGHDVYAQLEREEAAAEKERDYRVEQHAGDVADRLKYALRKDLGAHL